VIDMPATTELLERDVARDDPRQQLARVLVVIASYGRRNDAYLRRLIDEYRKMSFQVDIAVLSNLDKPLPTGVELLVGMPSPNPWSLPFAHKRLFVERVDRYDLFVYSEDDTLLVERQLRAFLEVSKVLQEDEVAGFLRCEVAADGTWFYSSVHSHYHWDPESLCQRGGEAFARFTNEHSACFLLTRRQLRRAIASGGFDVAPHAGRYDMLVTAATDPYTQCGLRKVICLSRLRDFTCRHLTNKYLGRTGVDERLVGVQVSKMLELAAGGERPRVAIPVETRLPEERWSKSYYERCREDVVDLIPAGTQSVLSIGCGWGATEAALIEKGIRVSALPLDCVIGSVAESRGVSIVAGKPDSVIERLSTQPFDALLVLGLLHLIADPVDALRLYRRALRVGGRAVITCPNTGSFSERVRAALGRIDLGAFSGFQSCGVHRTSASIVRSWLGAAGFVIEEVRCLLVGKWRTVNRLSLGLTEEALADEYVFVARTD
jgi:hypothetical protein